MTKQWKDPSDQKYRSKNREKILAYQKEWREKNSKKIAEQKRKWYEENKDRVLAERKKARESDPDKHRRSKREQYANNPHAAIRNARNREMGLKQRTPAWADLKAMDEVYRDAKEFRDGGINVHVDHIIPLRGKTVSGLHVENNITIKLASWNDSKGNEFDGDMV